MDRMATVRRAEPVLDERWAQFIEGGVSVITSSRDSQNIPALARALGCRVSANRQKVTVFVSAPQAEQLMKAIRSTGSLAAVFSQPSTHVSVQLKGNEAVAATARASDVQVAKRYVDAFVADVVQLGYPEDLIRTLLWSDPSDLVAITFSPTAAFLQTPGPRAGEPLR